MADDPSSKRHAEGAPEQAPDQAIAFTAHDHRQCQARILARAEAHCASGGLRLTPVRRQTLEILLEAHRAMGAYEVLERLADHGFGSQPPVAYRALDFLVEAGCAHRVRRVNGYTACMHPGERHDPVLLICEGCGMVAESPSGGARRAVGQAAVPLEFQLEGVNIEGVGMCPACLADDGEGIGDGKGAPRSKDAGGGR
ncbi:Fur family transcriptional regulator [Brevirhabdus pacifica]|uniref:Fur family transcriptional regulator n=1 Tax=Brevirhabdus pacifica TaxID=1267768 RepID=A0A1U7DHD9_9RHOB|nr:Fur family transcriptional regulator [Brevirhabdus pacifica]APX89410.1 Fur family transcriptional regulator [Brevirhabdus pacifica]PJJ85948.1 Fur family zinc uptake transcriptional regulator [Brevirhabdus pacifica]